MEKGINVGFEKLIESFRAETVQLEDKWRAGTLYRQLKYRRLMGYSRHHRSIVDVAKREDELEEAHILMLAERTREFHKYLKGFGYYGLFLG